MRAYDGLAPASALTDDILAEFGGDPVAMMNWARQAKPGDFGAFAPRVFERAGAHDPVAREIAGSAARAIRALTHGVIALAAERVALVGGVGEALRPYLEPDIAARLKRKPRNEGSLRGARIRRRTTARWLRARCRGRVDPCAHSL
jgi:glucosamine kinase